MPARMQDWLVGAPISQVLLRHLSSNGRRARCSIVMSRIGSVAAGVVVLSGLLAAGASAATVSWSAPVLVDHRAPLATPVAIADVACPSAHLCLGLEDHGVVTSTNPLGGIGAWHATSFLGVRGYSGAAFGSLTCAPGGRFCAAADAVGDL